MTQIPGRSISQSGPDLIARVQRFRDLRALVIGDLMLDTYLEGSASRLCREGPVPIVRQQVRARVPGGAANTAANLRSLGAHVEILGVLGEDDAGRELAAALRNLDIDDRWLVRVPGYRTQHKIRIVADGQYVVRLDEGDTVIDDAGVTNRLRENIARALERCDLVVISDYDYGVVSESMLGALAARREAIGTLVVDAKRLRHYRAIRPSIVTPNQLEAMLNADSDQSPDVRVEPRAIERVARELAGIAGAEQVVITLGDRGACLIDEVGAAHHLDASPVARVNDVGAGDSFTATVALALASGLDSFQAARVAVAAAGIAVTRQRTATVTYQEILQRVSLWGHAREGGSGEVALERLILRLREERLAGRTVVFTNGVFDILHAGHIAFLRAARQLGDVLVVGVNSDRGARAIKGPGRPINGEQDRLALVAALDPVDEVILFDEETPEALIRAIAPDIHAKGADYQGQDLPEAAAVEEAGGRVVILPLVGETSTTKVIDRIVAVAGNGAAGVVAP